jgi:hypothetical protein
MAFLIYISSSGEYLLFNGISGTLYLIKRPHPNSSSSSSSSLVVSTLLQAVRDDTLETVEVDALPEEGEYADVEGWTIYPDEKLKEMKYLVPRNGGFREKRVTLIMGRRNDEQKVLLFRSGWRYFLYKEGMIYQVEEPMKLGTIIPRLTEDRNEENLKLQKVGR